jgi:hypothetical protein
LKLLNPIALLSGLLLAGSALAGDMSDGQVRERIVEESVAAHAGSCACPDDYDAIGHACGSRSAQVKAGGDKVVCYPHEISDQQVREYRARHHIQ